MPIETSFDYGKKWTNPNDFPTYEENETKVREDMQLLFDQIRDALNAVASAIVAANIPFTATAEIPGVNNVADAIAAVQAQLAAVSTGQLPNGSVTTDILADDAVTDDKIPDDTITEEKLARTNGNFVLPPIALVSGVHYFDNVASLPDSASEGQIAFVKV